MRFVMQQPGSWSSGFWAWAQKEDGRDGGKGVNVCVCGRWNGDQEEEDGVVGHGMTGP